MKKAVLHIFTLETIFTLQRKADQVLYTIYLVLTTLQTHHVDSTLKRRGSHHLHVTSTWSPRGVFVGQGNGSEMTFVTGATKINVKP